jgi:hypothetical protein
MLHSRRLVPSLAVVLLAASACGSDDGHSHNEEEVINTVTLTFTPSGGGAAITAAYDDPDGDGGEAPTIDPIDLPPGDYTLTITFENTLEDPPEDITAEVEDEGDQHQIFLTGTAVDGPATDNAGAPLMHAYGDDDANGLPLGLTNDITAVAGTGTMTLTLRHMPPVNDTAVKVDGLAEQVVTDGINGLPGATDVSIEFDVTVE